MLKFVRWDDDNLRMRILDLTVPDLKTTFWDVAPSSVVEVYRRFRGASVEKYHIYKT
jgi:hypothetical protein